jgi:hypothetical protein
VPHAVSRGRCTGGRAIWPGALSCGASLRKRQDRRPAVHDLVQHGVNIAPAVGVHDFRERHAVKSRCFAGALFSAPVSKLGDVVAGFEVATVSELLEHVVVLHRRGVGNDVRVGGQRL